MLYVRRYRRKATVEAFRLGSAPGKYGRQIPYWNEVEARLDPDATPIGNNVDGKFECLQFRLDRGIARPATYACPGDWIVVENGGRPYAMNHENFIATFEDAENG